MNCAFEGIERIALVIHDDFKRFVVLVTAHIAAGHGAFLSIPFRCIVKRSKSHARK
jgi:hypothetical protein